MTGPATSRGSEWHWLWETYVVGVVGAAMLAVALLQHRFGGHVLPAVAALAAIAVGVLVLAKPLLRGEPHTWQLKIFIAAVVALWVLALLASPVAVVAIPMLYPLIFAGLPLRPALVVTTGVSLIPLVLTLVGAGRTANLSMAVAITLIGVVTAPIIGTVIVTSMNQRRTLAVLVSELAASRAETARLSRQAGAVAERDRMSREIHDTLAQGFTSIVALAQALDAELSTDPAAAARHIALIETTARENLAEARTIVAGVTPAALGDDTLPAAIRRQCRRLTTEAGIPVTVDIDASLPALGTASDVVLLRATQEALANTRKHAHATAAAVSMTRHPGIVRLSLSDNGIGLPDGHADGFGLRGMRARVQQVGGQMTVHSGDGVRIEIEVPA